MGWGIIRRQKWEVTGGICEFCNKPIGKISGACLHHKVNRKQGGKFTYDNAEQRHKSCEHEAHKRFPFGNREGNLKRGDRRGKKNRKSPQQDWRAQRVSPRDNHSRVGGSGCVITVRCGDTEVSIRSVGSELQQGNVRHVVVQISSDEVMGLA